MNGPSFRFSLERVRALRERVEDEAKGALAGAMQDASSAPRLRPMKRPVGSRWPARRNWTPPGLPSSAHDLIARQAYLERSEAAHRMSQEVLGRAEVRVQQRRTALTAAARDRQALERLKEHRRSDHEREQARVENAAMDEIAINGFRRRLA